MRIGTDGRRVEVGNGGKEGLRMRGEGSWDG